MKVGQEVYFIRENSSNTYNYEKPEVAVIVKMGKKNIHVKLKTTGVVHRFNMATLHDCSYTSHKLFLTQEDLVEELKLVLNK